MFNSFTVSKQDDAVTERIIVGAVRDKFFSIEFVKADGSKRTINGRLGVKKHLKGGRNCNVTLVPKHLTVYDMQKKGYRNVNLSTVKTLRVSNCTYKFA
tara:strand:- start:475 stop:771 length:297 start_codon:yes stop_codon:yes gene_type:complete